MRNAHAIAGVFGFYLILPGCYDFAFPFWLENPVQRILAIGGGGFMMEEGASPIDAYIRDLTRKPHPKICFLPTASGDLPFHIEKFYSTYESLGCEPSHLAFFRRPDRNGLSLSGFASRLLEQDAIFVGGGNTKSLLAVWREWGLDEVLRHAWKQGVLLTGMSAGAICWFQDGLTDSYGDSRYEALPGLGLLPGGCSVHHSSDANRRNALHSSLEMGAIQPTIAIDDCAAVLFQGDRVQQTVSWQPGATSRQLDFHNGAVREVSLASDSIAVPGR